MATHVGILPVDVIDALSSKLSGNSIGPTGHRFLRLPHPRTAVPSLFLPYLSPGGEFPGTKTTLLEVQVVAPPNARSWFMGEKEIVADGKLLVMTPVDPAFLMIPILQSTLPVDGTMGQFRTFDDIIEEAAAKLAKLPHSHSSKDLSTIMSEKDILHLASLDCIKNALKRICDVKEVTPEIVVYRFSTVKLLEYLRDKVARLATTEVFEGSRTLIRSLAKDGLMEDGKDNLLQSARVRASCDLIGQYVPQDIRSALLASYNFTELNAYFKAIEDDSASVNAAPVAKPKKVAETKTGDDKKRKLQTKTSQGVEKLKRVNVNGMAKMSSFFKKTA